MTEAAWILFWSPGVRSYPKYTFIIRTCESSIKKIYVAAIVRNMKALLIYHKTLINIIIPL